MPDKSEFRPGKNDVRQCQHSPLQIIEQKNQNKFDATSNRTRNYATAETNHRNNKQSQQKRDTDSRRASVMEKNSKNHEIHDKHFATVRLNSGTRASPGLPMRWGDKWLEFVGAHHGGWENPTRNKSLTKQRAATLRQVFVVNSSRLALEDNGL